jgi:cellulose biosynthesis protein BcsQ
MSSKGGWESSKPEHTEAPSAKRGWESSKPEHTEAPSALVYVFASAKGGTGKTILAATTIHLLLRAGKKVLAIDADFSTRGLSLYLLANSVRTAELRIDPASCLANAYFQQIPAADMKPLQVVRETASYDLILPNPEFRQGGVPDEGFLSGGSIPTETYFAFFAAICDRFRTQYDYIVIDTRGGYDFTSAVPAICADVLVMVVEADFIAVTQVRGLIEKLDELANRFQRAPARRGFIVNKSLNPYSPFETDLAERYNAASFGVVTADRDAIRAYQEARIPVDIFPDSDYAYYSSRTVAKLLALEETSADDSLRRLTVRIKRIAERWKARRLMDRAISIMPLIYIATLLAALVSYAAYAVGSSRLAVLIGYVALGSGLFVSLGVSSLAVLKAMQVRGRSKLARLAVFVFLLVLIAAAQFVLAFGVPRAFGQSQLLARITQQNGLIASQATTIASVRSELQTAQTDGVFLKTDRDRLSAALDQAGVLRQKDVDSFQERISAANKQLTAVQQQLTASKATNATLQADLESARAALVQQRQGSGTTSDSPQKPALKLAFVGSPQCGLLSLSNETSTTQDLAGWRLETTYGLQGDGTSNGQQAQGHLLQPLFVLPLEGVAVPSRGAVTLAAGSRCGDVVEALGVRFMPGKPREFVPATGQWSLRLIDKDGRLVDSIPVMSSPKQSAR